MHVLLISAAFPPMQIAEAEHALHLSAHLASRNVHVSILTTQGAQAVHEPVRVYPIMHRWGWRELPRLRRFLTSHRPDAVLLLYLGSMYYGEPMITFAPTIAGSILPGVRFVTQFETVYGTNTGECSVPARAVRLLVKAWAGSANVDYDLGTLVRDSDHLVALSDSFLVRLEEAFADARSKTSIIPPPPLLHFVREDQGAARRRGRELLAAADTDFVIMFFGRSYPGKGIETLLRAFHIVRRTTGNVRLAIVGGVLDKEYMDSPSYARTTRELARSLGIEDRVTWTGEYPSDSDHPSLYLWAADLCVLPLDSGVFMNNSAFGAAVAHGQPVVATRGASLDPQMIDRENVYLCPPRSPQALADAMLTVIQDPQLRERLRSGGRQLARDWFAWDRVVVRTIETLFSPERRLTPR
jgi:glycosyltransferase involved in cell wall biosynthesis